tara:strand:- start:16779 stop:17228 length:450 start_codon:yes stop_codon:yes gene_type:complete
MKRCSTCKDSKVLSEFHVSKRSKDGRAAQCKLCKKEQDRRRYEKHGEKHRQHVKVQRAAQSVINRGWVVVYLKDHPCADCGEADPIVLEFDHVRGSKRKNVAHMIPNGYSLRAVQQEVAKCEVRCANCHRRKTAKERGWDTLYDSVPIV